MRRIPGTPRRHCAVLVAVAGVACAPVPAFADVYAKMAFAEPDTRPKTIALVPVQAELAEAKLASSQESVAKAQPLEVAGTRAIAAALEQRGYEVRVLSVEDISSDPVLADARRRLHGHYAELRERLLARPYEVESRHYGFGKEGRVLAAHLGVEGIAVARMRFVSAGAGKAALAMTLGVIAGESGYARMDLAIVDGQTGNIHAFFLCAVSARPEQIHEHADDLVESLVTTTLEKYPAIDETLVKPDAPQQLIGRIGAGASDGLHSAWYVSGERDGRVTTAASGPTDAEVIAELKALLRSDVQTMSPAGQDSEQRSDAAD